MKTFKAYLEEVKFPKGSLKFKGIDFYPFPEIGSFIGNDNGHLMTMPMDKKGAVSLPADPGEVAELPKKIWTLVKKRIKGRYKKPALY